MVLVEPEQHQGVSVGTSFAVSEAGVWVTARHVVQGCTDIAERGPNGWDAVRVAWVHPHADMALIRSQGAPTHFALANDDIVSNQDGYAFGYPQGRPGSVHGHLIGRTQIRSPGLFTGTAPTLAWAEVERQPAFKGSLGGISGGPLLDANGRVLGVVVAEIPRRGRFETLAPEVLREVAAHGRLVPPTSHAPVVVSLPEADFGRVGDELREQYAVSQVACAVR